MNTDKKPVTPETPPRRLRPYAVALFIVCLVEAVFLYLLLTGGLHSHRGGIGFLFFLPATYVVWALFPHAGSDFVFGVFIFVVQAVFLVPPLSWVLTWKRRSAPKTILFMLSFVAIVLMVTALCARVINQREKRRDAAIMASRAAAVKSLRTLNVAIAEYKEEYGDYPTTLQQLGVSPADGVRSSDRANLVLYPVEAERYFVLTYQTGPKKDGKYTGYELRADPLPQEFSFLYNHYFTDQTGLIRSSTQRANANSLVIREGLRPTVIVE